MPTLFDFTYNLNAEDAQDAVLAAIADAAKKEYEPSTHFFADQNLLSAIVAANYATDAFGPVTGSLTTKYRTTSIVRTGSANPVKLFAICDGQILIQPQTGDATKVNLILKPTASFAPLKIKYFVYRGVNKADWIDASDNLPAVNAADPNQPALLKSVWAKFLAFNMPLFNLGLIPTPPNVLPAKLLGYNETDSLSNLAEHYFTRKINNTFFQIPVCKKGEHIGNFSGQVGLDIVLDHGDYGLVNQEELFKLDLRFARLKEHVFDTATIPSSTAVKVKRYKEHIHQFIDPAAFWGSHIKCGKIILFDNAAGITTNTDIYTKLITKYQTRNKIYIYIQGEKNRSYNYFETARKVYGFVAAGKLNDTNGWPICIEEITLTTATTTFKSIKKIQLDYSVSSSIKESDRHVAIDIVAPNNKTTIYPLLYQPPTPASPPATLTGKTPAASIQFPVNGTKSCAVFVFIYANLKQEFPVKDYFNDLFPVNLASNLYLPPGETNLTHWCTYDKSRMVNLSPALNLGASIQNKVIFDNGKNQIAGSPAVPTKKRRLYMAVLKRNTTHDAEYDKLNIDTITAGLSAKTNSIDEYTLNLYNDSGFSAYRGNFTDGADTINSLTLFHDNSLTKKDSYFHLAITEEEYNKLVYDSASVPAIVPPATAPAQILPMDADNVFFNLVKDAAFVNPQVSKYKVGLRYEDNTGAVVTVLPASPVNDVFVYTLDGFYFFSKEYSLYQEFFQDYPKCKVDFRVKLPYAGEFGFDWMRDGLTGTGAAIGDVPYKTNVGKLYKDAAFTTIETNTNQDNGFFNPIASEYKKLETRYKSYPVQVNPGLEKYIVPTMRIYPPYSLPPAGAKDLDRQTIFAGTYDDTKNRVAKLVLMINIVAAPVKLELKYDATIFTVVAGVLPTAAGTHSVDVTITCLKDFGAEELIRVIAYYGADKKGVIAGTLTTMPNVKTKRFSKKLVFIEVVTNLNGAATPPALTFTFDQQAKNLMMFLRQIGITPIVETEKIDMVATPDATFNSKYVYTNPTTLVKRILGYNRVTPIAPVANALDYLYSKLKNQVISGTTTKIGNKYDKYFKVFFFHDKGGYMNTPAPGTFAGLSGYSHAGSFLADFPNVYPSTTTHEFLHTANVQHTFANSEGSAFAEYTYTPNATDNIMDYSDVNNTPSLPTVSLFEWQGKIAQKKVESEP
jgi:hypothetical protein